MRIANWEVIRHGVEWSDYFQGCGVAFTEYTDCVTGIGDTELDALDDCLEQMACSHDWADGELDKLEQDIRAAESDMDNTGVDYETSDGDDCEHPWYHVSIRWTLQAVPA